MNAHVAQQMDVSASSTQQETRVTLRYGAAASRRATPPQAPSSKEVAQRILTNASLVPLKRFDSADFFLEQHRQKLASDMSRDASLSPELPRFVTQQNQLRLEEPLAHSPLKHTLGRFSPTCVSPIAVRPRRC